MEVHSKVAWEDSEEEKVQRKGLRTETGHEMPFRADGELGAPHGRDTEKKHLE